MRIQLERSVIWTGDTSTAELKRRFGEEAEIEIDGLGLLRNAVIRGNGAAVR